MGANADLDRAPLLPDVELWRKLEWVLAYQRLNGVRLRESIEAWAVEIHAELGKAMCEAGSREVAQWLASLGHRQIAELARLCLPKGGKA